MSGNDSPRPLEQLHLHLTGSASLECRGCQAVPQQPADGCGHPPFLPLDTILQALDEAMPLGLEVVRLCGGNSFDYPHWDALLEALQKRDLRVDIETDGSCLTQEQVARVARLPRAMVIFEWTPNLLASPSSAQPDPAGAAIRMLSDAGVTLRFIAPITRRVVSEIPEIIRAAEQSGAKSIRFTSPPPHPGSNGHAQGSNANLTVEEAIAVGRKVERKLSMSTPLRLVFDLPPVFRGLYPQARVEGQGYCAVLNRLSILPDGTVALCGAVETIPELLFGKPGNPGLEEIWLRHPTLVSLRAGMPGRLEGICGHCIMKTACMGYCIAENYLRSGSFFGPNWFCQSAEQAGLFPAGRIIENTW